MPIIGAKGSPSSAGFGQFAQASAVPNYIEDVFSTYLYTGNGSAISIVNGIDLSGKGGMVWQKTRSAANNNWLFDTIRGDNSPLSSNNTNSVAQNISGFFGAPSLLAATSTGFNINTGQGGLNSTSSLCASWTFRKQPKFFDVVTYTGTGSARTIAHNLGATPGCIIVKSTSDVTDWAVYHRSLTSAANGLQLNGTSAQLSVPAYWNSTAPTSTVFSVGADNDTNGSGRTYVAYIFAHDAGGFGLTGTDNVISCGSFTPDGSGNATVNLGYEPQWVMIKVTGATGNWAVFDNMRGMPVGNTDVARLFPNTTAAESSSTDYNVSPTATGFTAKATGYPSIYNFIYIAIRRGPMKVPTSGTSVYQANTYTGNATANTTVAGNFGFPVDLMLLSSRNATATSWSAYGQLATDRLRGSSVSLPTSLADTEAGGWNTYQAFDVQNSIGWGLYGASSGSGYLNNSFGTFIARGFKRAPSFFDEVCYTGNSATPRTITHNLGVAPELMIIKSRSNARGWAVYASAIGNNKYLILNGTNAALTDTTIWVNTAPTSSVFTVGDPFDVNNSGYTYVAYLFATCAGVSKVGSYTGTGALQTINCGFTSGASFVLIKRTDSTGDWYTYDSARGITSGNDPYLFLNSTAAEVTGTNYVDTDTTGFKVTAAAPAGLNASGGTYIFLAIA